MLHLLVESASHPVPLLARHWISEKDTRTCQNFKLELRLTASSVFWGLRHRHFEGFWHTKQELYVSLPKLLEYYCKLGLFANQGTRCCGKLRSSELRCLQPSLSAYCDSHSKYQAKRLAIDLDIARPLCPWAPSSSVASRDGWLFNRFYKLLSQFLINLLFQSIAIQ